MDEAEEKPKRPLYYFKSRLFLATYMIIKKGDYCSECEKSLKRLGVETIDLYFAHAFDEKTPLEETMEAFCQLKKSGKIRFAGASNFMAVT